MPHAGRSGEYVIFERRDDAWRIAHSRPCVTLMAHQRRPPTTRAMPAKSRRTTISGNPASRNNACTASDWS